MRFNLQRLEVMKIAKVYLSFQLRILFPVECKNIELAKKVHLLNKCIELIGQPNMT